MADLERAKKCINVQLSVGANRLERILRKLDVDDLLSLYEDGCNLFYAGENLHRRAIGASLVSAAVTVLGERYEAVRDLKLDLREPFPLRRWMAGEPAQ